MAVDTSSFPEQVKAAIENGSYTADDLIITSKISGQKMSWLDYHKELKSGAAKEEGDAPAAAPAGATAAAPPTPAAGSAAPAGVPFPQQVQDAIKRGVYTEDDLMITSKISGQKMSWLQYRAELKGRGDDAGDAPAASPDAAPAAAAPTAAPSATATAEAPGRPGYYPYVEVEQKRVTADTVSRRKVTRPSGIPDADRRGFFGWALLGWTAFAAAMGLMKVALIRFMFPNVLFEPPSSFKIGFPDEFEIGLVETKFKALHGVWVIRDEDGIYVLSTVCTHLGCTPNWLESDQKFKCPCHGSGFRKSGVNFEGPAPRPLERFRIVMAEDGQILVDKSKKYQFEKGQWDDPESLLPV
ncbi:MAG: ubiquinol-cytochrome c reductase iron-sulfur subunit [Planctomycetota bacterium]|nr:ubiquinol-cytochrome c reductase iron-sulfur subunit [Planctomycetota bacterium]